MLLKEKKDTVHWVHWASLCREMFAWDTGQLDNSVIIIKNKENAAINQSEGSITERCVVKSISN